MNTVSYVNREYVPRVDLQTLGTTYNTLEQGHQAAVKAASDLKTTVANMDMDASEDGFKELLIGEIQQTVDDNTLYGNAYGALDNLVKQVGDINSDGRVIGRLRNHKAKVDYDAKVDAMAIPDGMKQMYKEENPYYYEDGDIDPNTGRVQAGELWQPVSEPVTTVDEFAVMDKARQMVATEAGGYDDIVFLDANGRPTRNSSESADSAMYMQIGTKFEKLPKQKLKEAIQLARRTIAGAEDSFRQDYKYENWKYNKEIEKLRASGDTSNPVIDGFTDDDGNILTYEDWLDCRFDEFADKASYTHVYTDTKIGTAYENYKKRQALNSGGNKENGYVKPPGANIIGEYVVTRNSFAEAVGVKDGSNDTSMNIIKGLNIEEFNKYDNVGKMIDGLINDGKATDASSAAGYVIDTYGRNMSTEDKFNLITSFVTYQKSNEEVNNMLKAAGSDGDALMFSANMNSEIYTNDNSIGELINGQNNTIFQNWQEVRPTVGKNLFQSLKNIYKVQNWEDTGIPMTTNERGEIVFSFTGNNRNKLPAFLYNLDLAFQQTPEDFGNYVKRKTSFIDNDTGDSGYRIDCLRDGEITSTAGSLNRRRAISNESELIFGDMLRTYKDGAEKARLAQEKVGNYSGVKTLVGTDVTTEGELYVEQIAGALNMTYSEKAAAKKEYRDAVKNSIASGALSGGAVYLVGDPDNIDSSKLINHRVGDSSRLNLLLQHMCSTNKDNITVIHSPGDDNIDEGYLCTFTVPSNDKSDAAKPYIGQTISIYITGSIDDGSGYKMSANPLNMAQCLIGTSKATGAPVSNAGYIKQFGDTRLFPTNNGTYTTHFIDDLTLDEKSAENYIAGMHDLEILKASAMSNIWSDRSEEEQRTILNNNVVALSQRLSTITGIEEELVERSIWNYLYDTSK